MPEEQHHIPFSEKDKHEESAGCFCNPCVKVDKDGNVMFIHKFTDVRGLMNDMFEGI